MKLSMRKHEADLTSLQIELCKNKHLKFEAESKRDNLVKVGFKMIFQNDIPKMESIYSGLLKIRTPKNPDFYVLAKQGLSYISGHMIWPKWNLSKFWGLKHIFCIS